MHLISLTWNLLTVVIHFEKTCTTQAMRSSASLADAKVDQELSSSCLNFLALFSVKTSDVIKQCPIQASVAPLRENPILTAVDGFPYSLVSAL